MDGRLRGQLAKPRVAFVGTFLTEELEALEAMFPTTWKATTLKSLSATVDARDVDVVVIGEDQGDERDRSYFYHCYVISFSINFAALPGPCDGVDLTSNHEATTTEFRLPNLPLPISRRLDTDLAGLTSVRGWIRLDLRNNRVNLDSDRAGEAKGELLNGAIVIEVATGAPLACKYISQKTDGAQLGVACLPNCAFDRPGWVRVILDEWAKLDTERFPGWGDWKGMAKWQTRTERQLSSAIDQLESEKSAAITEMDQRIATSSAQLQQARQEVDNGLRKLITGKGNELVDQVASSLETIGFTVRRMDPELDNQKQKIEDLRLSVPNEDSNWTAIVEVRGYEKSSHRMTDLHGRLGRFSELYQIENGRLPDKRIYVVNGQICLPPAERQRPLDGCDEDIQVFSDAQGLVIWTLDLYKFLAQLDDGDELERVRDAIRASVGYLDLSGSFL